MVGTAQTVIFDAAEKQRRQPMRTKGADQTQGAVFAAKQHHILTEEFDPNRSSARLANVGSRRYRDPVLAKQVSQQGSRPDFRKRVIFFLGEVVNFISAGSAHAFRFHWASPFHCELPTKPRGCQFPRSFTRRTRLDSKMVKWNATAQSAAATYIQHFI
jgi:hypothetical protein